MRETAHRVLQAKAKSEQAAIKLAALALEYQVCFFGPGGSPTAAHSFRKLFQNFANATKVWWKQKFAW
jgi:hypothetical protein